jgi:hypothetical protein
MTNDDYRATLDGFIEDLKRVWRAVGGPSYHELDKLSAKLLRPPGSRGATFVPLAPSTTSEILSGRRKQAPRWPWVLTFLTVLQTVAEQGAIDPAVVGTIDEWNRKYESVLAAGPALQRPAYAGTGAISTAPAPVLPGGACSEADTLMAIFLALLRRADAPQWWRQYRGIAPEWLDLYLSLESGTEIIRTYETRVVPGLLQAEAYATAILAQCRPGATANELTRLVELRMERQELYHYRQSRRLWAIVEETAFRNRRIDAWTRRVQIEHLIDMTEERNVTLQVVPASTGGSLTLSEPMTIFRFPAGYLGDVVCLEQPDSALFLHERKDTEHYNQLFDNLAVKASSPEITRGVLRKIRDEIS